MKLKIALVSEHVASSRGGAEISTSQFLHHVLDHGAAVELYTTSALHPADNLVVRTLDVSRYPRSWRTSLFLQWAARHLSDVAPDTIVHAMLPCSCADIYEPRGGTVAETIARNLAIMSSPVTRSLKRFANLLNRKQRRLLKAERALLRRNPPPTVVAISNYVTRQLHDHYQLDSGGICENFNGVDFHPPSPSQRDAWRRDLRQLYGIEDHHALAILVAHNFRLKGVPSWLRAVGDLHRRHPGRFRSIIVGKGSARRYGPLMAALNLDEVVTFAGPTREIAAFYAAADLVVHPTWYDPCSRVVMEAMLHGVPCVSTRYNGASEIIEDGVTGRIVDTPDNITALSAAAEEVTAPSFRAALQGQHQELRWRLSMRRHAEQMMELYHSVLARRRA